MRDFLATAQALSNPTRVRILKLLEEGELCVCHIQERIGGAQSTISKHLGILHQAGLVTYEKDGLWAFYRLEDQPIHAHNLAFLALVRQALNDDPEILSDRGARASVCCPTGEKSP